MSIKPLRFSLNLYDRASPGLKAFSGQLATVNRQINRTKYDMRNLFTGVTTTVGSVFAAQGLVGPARELQAAQGELATLFDAGMNDSAISTVTNMAMNFSEEFGVAASSVVSSAYDIQSAIDGLNGTELSAFTRSSALLARATKADTGTITSYMGTMNSIFAEEANRLGNAAWVEQIAGQTAAAVRKFKTDGNNLSAAFSNLGARASNQGITAAEQFSVLGMLQSTMGGANAGTAYANFMDQLAVAQNRLGMNFSGEDGRALGVGEIIEQLRDRYGTDWNNRTAGIINQAFGTTAGGLIQNLWKKTDELNSNIVSLASVSDASIVEDMARNRIDIWDQLAQSVTNVRAQFGASLNDAVRPFINYLIGGAQTLRRWIEMFPNLTKVVAFATLAVIASTGAIGAWMAVTASARIAAFAFSIALSPIAKKLLLVTVIAYGIYKVFTYLRDLFGGYEAAVVTMVTGFVAITFATSKLSKGFGIAIPLVKGLFIALKTFAMANPLVAAIVGAISVGMLMWRYWDEICEGFKTAFAGVGTFITNTIDQLLGLWRKFIGIFSSDSEKIGVDMETHQQTINGALPAAERPLQVDSGTQANQTRMGNLTSGDNIGGQTVHIGSQSIYVDSMTTPEQMNLYNQMGMPY